MNRTQKKCFLVSAGLHLLMGFILVVGPAFLWRRSQSQNFQVLNFIPDTAIDANASGGGTPAPKPPAPAAAPAQPPPQPQPAPEPPPRPRPQPVRQPEPEPEPPKLSRPSPDALEPVHERKHKIVVNTHLVTRSGRDRSRERALAERRAQQAAEARERRLAAALGRAASALKNGLAGSTEIKFSDGFGGGGPSYANWLQIVESVYYNDWNGTVPQGATESATAALASVTIGRDGTVISARIIQSSGSAAVDKSIRATLERVKFVAPFPDGATEEKREITITFKVTPNTQLLG